MLFLDVDLADLGTAIVTISGGEPLMHPELEAVIERIRERGMLAGLISNGYLMSRKRIQSLNAACDAGSAAIFPISDGWKDTRPNNIHLWEPPITGIKYVIPISIIRTPYK